MSIRRFWPYVIIGGIRPQLRYICSDLLVRRNREYIGQHSVSIWGKVLGLNNYYKKSSPRNLYKGGGLSRSGLI